MNHCKGSKANIIKNKEAIASRESDLFSVQLRYRKRVYLIKRTSLVTETRKCIPDPLQSLNL